MGNTSTLIKGENKVSLSYVVGPLGSRPSYPLCGLVMGFPVYVDCPNMPLQEIMTCPNTTAGANANTSSRCSPATELRPSLPPRCRPPRLVSSCQWPILWTSQRVGIPPPSSSDTIDLGFCNALRI